QQPVTALPSAPGRPGRRGRASQPPGAGNDPFAAPTTPEPGDPGVSAPVGIAPQPGAPATDPSRAGGRSFPSARPSRRRGQTNNPLGAPAVPGTEIPGAGAPTTSEFPGEGAPTSLAPQQPPPAADPYTRRQGAQPGQRNRPNAGNSPYADPRV